MAKPSKLLRDTARQLADAAARSPLKDLEAARAAMAAAIFVGRNAGMTSGDVAAWLTALAKEEVAK